MGSRVLQHVEHAFHRHVAHDVLHSPHDSQRCTEDGLKDADEQQATGAPWWVKIMRAAVSLPSRRQRAYRPAFEHELVPHTLDLVGTQRVEVGKQREEPGGTVHGGRDAHTLRVRVDARQVAAQQLVKLGECTSGSQQWQHARNSVDRGLAYGAA